MSCRENCCKTLSFLFVLFALGILAVPAFAGDPCVQAAFGSNVVCTANDVRIAFADNPRHLDGTPFDATHGCQKDSTFSFIADFHVVTTATARENIGLYFQTSGSGNAVTGTSGTCSDNIIAPPHLATGGAACLGSGGTAVGIANCHGVAGTYEELDTGNKKASLNEPYNLNGGTTGCGDISTNDNNQVITIEVDNVTCEPGPDGFLRLPNATSWQQPGGTIFCAATGNMYPWSETHSAIPGSPSKCNQNDAFEVPIIVQSPTASVSKSCSLDGGTTTSTSCDFGTNSEGGTVTYTVTVSNTSSFGTLTLNEICDNYYGTIALASGQTAHPCWGNGSPAGTPNSSGNTCSAPQTLQPQGSSGDTYTCHFTATQGENATVNNIAYAYGIGADGKTGWNNNSSQVTVVSHDIPATATIAKTWVSTKSACVTVRYKVDVAATADGPLTLTGLTDDSYDLTKLNTDTNNAASPVVGTTCGIASGQGRGTTSDLSAGGAFSTINVGGPDYVCYFDANFCGNVGAITGGNGYSCSTGIQHTDTVNGSLTGDEGESVSVTPGSVTVNECIVTTAQ